MQKSDIDNIRLNLKYGDNLKIQQATGLSLPFISEVLNGKKKSDNVLEAAAKIAAANVARQAAILAIMPKSNSIPLRSDKDGEEPA
jgi:hypothetical protein